MALSVASCLGDPAERPSVHPCPIGSAENTLPPDEVAPLPSNDPGCPSSLYNTDCSDVATCYFNIACQSGMTVFALPCEGGSLSFWPIPCSLPYNSCPEIWRICHPTPDGKWLWEATGGPDYPPMCPWARPAEASSCPLGYYGNSRCGFWCDETHSAWTVAVCTPVDDGPASQRGSWVYDDACRPACRISVAPSM